MNVVYALVQLANVQSYINCALRCVTIVLLMVCGAVGYLFKPWCVVVMLYIVYEVWKNALHQSFGNY